MFARLQTPICHPQSQLKHSGDFQKTKQRAWDPQSMEDEVKGVGAGETVAHRQDAVSTGEKGLIEVELLLGGAEEVRFVP